MLQYSARRYIALLAVFVGVACSSQVAPSDNRGSTRPSFDRQDIAHLFEASASGDLREVMQIVESNGSAIVDYQLESTLATPLLRAVEFRHIEVAEYLLAHGAKANPENREKSTPLMQAAYLGDSRMVELLLKAGADPNRQETRFGDTPLTLAAWKGHEEVVKLLLTAGADPTIKTKDGDTARERAERRRYSEIIEALDAAAKARSQ